MIPIDYSKDMDNFEKIVNDIKLDYGIRHAEILMRMFEQIFGTKWGIKDDKIIVYWNGLEKYGWDGEIYQWIYQKGIDKLQNK